ncbi:terminase small subunit [Methylolobus aquaticus]
MTLVRDYMDHLRSEDDRRNQRPKQRELAEHLDLSERALRDLLSDLGIDHKQCTRDEVRVAYIRRLREQAAGRATSGDLSLSEERAGLAREQKLLARIRKRRELGEWAPIENITLVLSRVTSQMASTFDGIPVQLKRRFPGVTAEQMGVIREELAKARNLLVSAGTKAIEAEAMDLVDYVDEYDDGCSPGD